MQAIETIYNGYRFRSRLEARWAVFFDALGIPYEYEKEGYELDGGVRYLPDFWLPQYQAYIEIKGQRPSHEEKDKAFRLAYQSRRWVYVLWGNLGENEYSVIAYSNDGREYACNLGFAMCPLCGDLLFRSGDYCDSIGQCFCACWPDPQAPRLTEALTAARQARFEHGEQPIIPRQETPPKVEKSPVETEQVDITAQLERQLLAFLYVNAPELDAYKGRIDSKYFTGVERQTIYMAALGNPIPYSQAIEDTATLEELRSLLADFHRAADGIQLDHTQTLKTFEQMILRVARQWTRNQIKDITLRQQTLELSGNREAARGLRQQAQDMTVALHRLDVAHFSNH